MIEFLIRVRFNAPDFQEWYVTKLETNWRVFQCRVLNYLHAGAVANTRILRCGAGVHKQRDRE
jgi:hypothetical protein